MAIITCIGLDIVTPEIGNREKHQGKHKKYPKKGGKQ